MNTIRYYVLMLSALCLLGLSCAIGQEPKMTRFYILSPENIADNHAGRIMLDKWDTLDISRIRVTYQVSVLRDTLSPEPRQTDRMVVEIGDRWIKSYGQTLWRINQNRTLYAAGKGQTVYPDLQDLVIDFTVYRNRFTDSLTNQQTLPFLENRAIVYYEPKPSMAWNLTSDVKKIAGYTCHRGTTRFRGRDWTVWFTPEIPVDCGLWKFNGLPGLILEAADSRKHYHFYVHEIAEISKAILFYEAPAIYTNRDNWMKMTQKVYRNPVDFFKTEADFYLVEPQTESSRKLDETWSLPYNPLELE